MLERTPAERLAAVAELHRPVVEWVIPIECSDGDCDHEDCPKAEIPMTICEECSSIREEENDDFLRRPWPCATAMVGGFATVEGAALTASKKGQSE